MWSGPAQPFDRDDAQLRQPRRHLRQRRALLRRLPEGERRPPPDARRGDRGDGLRLGAASPAPSPARCPTAPPIWYQKHMWHHMVGPVGYDDFAGFTHAFLIRDPAPMIASYLRKREAAAFEDFGLDRQADFFAREADRLGHAPPVVDANDVLADPEGTLRALCAAPRHPVRSGHAELAARPPRHRRPLGAALVPGGRGQHRLRPARRRARPTSRTKRAASPTAAVPITSSSPPTASADDRPTRLASNRG